MPKPLPDPKSPKVTERIYAAAFATLKNHPQGLRWTDLINLIKESDPGFHPKTVNGSIWKFVERYPERVYRDGDGLFKLK